jgi:hypothetical protein
VLVPISWDEHLTMELYSGPCLQTLLEEVSIKQMPVIETQHMSLCPCS